MTYAAGFAVGERESFAHRRAGTLPTVPNTLALSAHEQGRRDALFARSQQWAAQGPDRVPYGAVALPEDAC